MLQEVLQRIVSGTDVTKNVNKNNATHAVLFEAINLSIHLGQNSDSLPQVGVAVEFGSVALGLL